MFTLVARGPQGYKVVRYNAFRYLDLKEGSDGAHLIASVKPFQTLGPEIEMHFWAIDLLHVTITRILLLLISSSARATFVKSTGMQRFLKTI